MILIYQSYNIEIMSSTRNKNSVGDYQAEQRALQRQADYFSYVHYAHPENTYFCGDGLVGGGKIGSSQLSNNYCDIESSLRGIGSTNLVNPMQAIQPDIKQLKSLSIIDKLPVVLPSSWVCEPNQRQRFLL
jgi:hypothetical protein